VLGPGPVGRPVVGVLPVVAGATGFAVLRVGLVAVGAAGLDVVGLLAVGAVRVGAVRVAAGLDGAAALGAAALGAALGGGLAGFLLSAWANHTSEHSMMSISAVKRTQFPF
jgi:hypothetical protein